jgi:hypothetical protein
MVTDRGPNGQIKVDGTNRALFVKVLASRSDSPKTAEPVCFLREKTSRPLISPTVI